MRIDIMKNLPVFKGRINAMAVASNTEASEGNCVGAACIAWLIQPVENQNFL
jgi:hypothetical protein